jgi:hypothetical protein
MSDSWMEYPEVSGKTVDHLHFYSDPSGAHELHIQFTDGEALSIRIQTTVGVEGELYREAKGGDIQILSKYRNR